MPSGGVRHSLHAESLLSLTLVLWMVYNCVGNSCLQISNMPSMVGVGQVGQSLSPQKHRSALSSSSLSISVTSFPCHLTSYRTLDSRCRLRRFFAFFLGITSPSSVTQTRSAYSSRSYKSYPFAYATASFVSPWRPTLSARSSKSRTIFIAGSLL